MKFFKSHVKFTVKLIILSVLVLLFILFIILKLNPDIAEFWSSTFVKYYLVVVGTITKVLPFSLTEIYAIAFVVLIGIFVVLCLVYLFKKHFIKSLDTLLTVGIMVFSVLSSYQMTAEMMYNRKKVEVPMYNQWVEKDKFKEIVNYFIDDLNYCCDQLEFEADGNLVMPYDIDTLNTLIEKEYRKFNSDYLFDFTVKNKPMTLLSWLYVEFHITGVTYIPLAEPNINIMNVNAGKGFTACHEIAHTKGAMREEDADLVASYITLHSSNPYLRYSGYYYTIGSLLTLGRYTGVEGDYSELYARLDSRFKSNLSYNSKYWKEHNKAKDFANYWNDLYLKISGQNKGSSSYGDSETVVNPTTKEITSFSDYQKLYFEIYYSNHQ